MLYQEIKFTDNFGKYGIVGAKKICPHINGNYISGWGNYFDHEKKEVVQIPSEKCCIDCEYLVGSKQKFPDHYIFCGYPTTTTTTDCDNDIIPDCTLCSGFDSTICLCLAQGGKKAHKVFNNNFCVKIFKQKQIDKGE